MEDGREQLRGGGRLSFLDTGATEGKVYKIYWKSFMRFESCYIRADKDGESNARVLPIFSFERPVIENEKECY
jgi:hypothetical protein